MAIKDGPEWFSPLPDKGQRIRGKRKAGQDRHWEDYEGVVELVFASPGPDDPGVKLTSGLIIFPSLGDTWESVND